MQNAMPANAFLKVSLESSWEVGGSLLAFPCFAVSFSQSCSGLIWSDVLYCGLLFSPFSSPPFVPSLALSPAQSRLVCVFCSVCVCILKEAGVERMYNYTQQQQATGVGPCCLVEAVTWRHREAGVSTEVPSCIARL